jgi:NAD(P)-dependent dehydrogenase (short-subunit alcohol dehydrogenase family)
MDRNSRFEGKVVIVTGGGSGIGKEIVLHFAREKVGVAVADINQATAEETQRALAPCGLKSLALRGGVISLPRVLAGELVPYGINVNAVCPGLIVTPISENFLNSEIGKVIGRNIPWSRFGKPEDVAAAVLFLASPEADYITGTILPVGGGLSSFLDFGEEYRTFDRQKPSL